MKNLFFGLVVVATALGASAFTNVKTLLPGDRLVQTSSGQYEKINVAYNPSLYCDLSTAACSYIQVKAATYTLPINQATIDSINATTPGTFVPEHIGEYAGPLN
ncbi:hypothetical protein [Pedobacter nyackensis]|uniref:hypothetical protein n=1 Tax=Pedobacter nyackensis TaxID=475255 RepID=UPI002931511F|nr:hypothetical protein [Pedobacter nyackensis]